MTEPSLPGTADDRIPGDRPAWAVAALPAALSLVLSLATVGSHPFWQDSGVFLTAVKELGVLYPPGFVAYELLCRAWTGLFFFLDFTLAVHLFSSACAALAAGVITLAARDLLRSTARNLRIATAEEARLADPAAVLVGVVVASGYTFWSTAIYAKGYAFFYLVLSLLLWRMIRAEETGSPRDATWVAVLAGLAWQAHPSAALAGGALLLFLLAHARRLGARGVLGRVGIAAATALGPTLLVLPVLLGRHPWLELGHPRDLAGYLRYAIGIRFVGMHGVFGWEPTRWQSLGRFTWEDLLGVGSVLGIAGLAVTARRNPRLLAGALAWVLPYCVVTLLLKIEGQGDCWLVAARLPLALLSGAGAAALARPAGPRAGIALGILGLLGVAWAVGANFPDLEQRDYRLAEQYGRIVLDTPDRDAVVLLSGDDPNGLSGYLQRVRGERPDLVLVASSFLVSEVPGTPSWYLEGLLRRAPFLRAPDEAGLRERFPAAPRKLLSVAAFMNANASGGRPIFSEVAVPAELLRPDFRLVPAGIYWKLEPAARRAAPPDPRYWRLPIEAEEVRPLYRRARGQSVADGPSGIVVKPQPYERRLASLILEARIRLALALADHGQFAGAARLCQSVVDYDDPDIGNNAEVIHLLGISYFAANQFDRAEPALRRSTQISLRVESRATAWFYLGQIARSRGDEAQAQRDFAQALSLPGLSPDYRREMESRLRPK